MLPHTMTEVHRDLIIGLAAKSGLPSVHAFRTHPAAGALASYGVGVVDHFRPAADYIDRILKGVTPADLPVQAPATRRHGELDNQLAPAKKPVTAMTTRKAA